MLPGISKIGCFYLGLNGAKGKVVYLRESRFLFLCDFFNKKEIILTHAEDCARFDSSHVFAYNLSQVNTGNKSGGTRLPYSVF